MPDDQTMDPELERLHRAALRDPAATAELMGRARDRTGVHREITTPADLHRAVADAQGFYFGYYAPNDRPLVPVWRALDGREVRVNLVSPTPMNTAALTNGPTFVGKVVKFLGMQPAPTPLLPTQDLGGIRTDGHQEDRQSPAQGRRVEEDEG